MITVVNGLILRNIVAHHNLCDGWYEANVKLRVLSPS